MTMTSRPGAADLLRLTSRRKLAADVKPEITSSMIELSTGICERHHDVITQLLEVRDALVEDAARLNLRLCGGGTHAFQDWSRRRIFDTPRFRQVSQLYGYLSKQFTVFGQHVHIGCTGPDQAVVAAARDEPFRAARDRAVGVLAVRPGHRHRLPVGAPELGLRLPAVGARALHADLEGFRHLLRQDAPHRGGRVDEGLYWDIRPKPEFGTIEVRVMDTPLTVERAAAIAAYLQCVARWLVLERPFEPNEDDYLVYTYNRFQACRFGLDGVVVEPRTAEHRPLRELIAQTIKDVEMHAIELRAERGLALLREVLVAEDGSDAAWLRSAQAREQYLPEVVPSSACASRACERASGVAHVGHRLAPIVRAPQVGQHLARRHGRAVEPASGLHLHEGFAVGESRRIGATQLHLHVGVDDPGRERDDACTVVQRRLFERLCTRQMVEAGLDGAIGALRRHRPSAQPDEMCSTRLSAGQVRVARRRQQSAATALKEHTV